MKKVNKIDIDSKEYIELVELAQSLKTSIGIGSDVPIANDLELLLDKKEIILVTLPIETPSEKPFAALLLEVNNEQRIDYYIGLNSNDYYDKQIFAIAHELYHYLERTDHHISRGNEDSPAEEKAELFAAEFLLPLQTLKKMIISEFGTLDFSSMALGKLLRFIAKIHCYWWLPYKSIVRRLGEAGAISQKIFHELYLFEERNPQGEYYRIGLSTNEDIFLRLNKITQKSGTELKNLETLARNYEDGILDEEEMIRDLALFSKNPEDMGLEYGITDDDDEEMGVLFSQLRKADED
jgi:Zn-dependent peptidase ImmA (M78 family)